MHLYSPEATALVREATLPSAKLGRIPSSGGAATEQIYVFLVY